MDSKIKEAESPRSQSHRADALRAPLGGNLNKLYFETAVFKLKEPGWPPLQSHRADTLTVEFRKVLKRKKAESLPSDAKLNKSPPSQSHHAETLTAPLTAKLNKLWMNSETKEWPSPWSQSPSEVNKLYLFFWHAYSTVIYSLYEIEVPKLLPPPLSKADQELEIRNPRPLLPLLQLKTGKYPDHMCCVQLGSKLYFFGGEFNNDNPYIDKEVKDELKNVKRDVFPRDVYTFDLAFYSSYSPKVNVELLLCNTSMNSGKASPQAFMADEKIYVVGSICDDLDLKSFDYFEVYDPVDGNWTVLPNPPIRNVNTRWVGHAVVGRKALLVACQQGKERLYCFDLDTDQWTKYASLPSYPDNFSGRTEFVEDTLYGCYHSTVAGIAPLAEEKDKEDMEEEEEEEEEEGEEEEDEAKGVQQPGSLFKRVRLLKHHGLHFVSEEMGMDAIFNVPPQLQSSSSLLHLGNRHFCYVRTGMPPHPIHGSDYAILDDKRRFISIVIFRAIGETYKEDATRLFKAKFLHSAHYVVDTPFPIEGFIDGCFSLGSCCFKTIIKEGEASSSHTPLFSSEFSFSELNVATRNFDPSLKIGAGGYGNIYKGVLHHTPVAIKMLASHSSQGTSEFKQEVGVLSKLRHPNLVTLIGFCPEFCAIIYEYLPNGSLEDRLNCQDNSPPLSWQIRIRIAAELCSALIFLHSCKPYSIVHGDVKPSNILLDANFVSKLSDFGISRLLDRSSNSKLTNPKGTFFYVDPEFLSTGELTQKSDVYAFGIVLLQLLTGRQPMRIRKDMQDALDTGNLKVFLDPLAGVWPFVQAEQLAHLALRCCESNPKSRPDLGSDVYREVMQDPNVAADSFTYKAAALREWLDSGHDTSRVTNVRLEHCNLVPNHSLRSAIQDCLQQH